MSKNYYKYHYCYYFTDEITNNILLVICNFINEITYNSLVNDMLHYIEGIIDRIKQKIIFDVYFLFIKLSVNLLMIHSHIDWKSVFLLIFFIHEDPVDKIIINKLLI